MAEPKITASEMANCLLLRGGMSHLKLQKLLFYCQAFHLAVFDEPLFADDFEAWMHGPVVRSVWNDCRDHSVLHNGLSLTDLGKEKAKQSFEKLSKDQTDLIDDVLAEYEPHSAYKLECLTHSEKPWIDARAGIAHDAASKNIIPKKSIGDFYRTMIYGADEQKIQTG